MSKCIFFNHEINDDVEKHAPELLDSLIDHLEKKPTNAINGRECIETRETLAIDWSLSGSYLITIEKMVVYILYLTNYYL